MKLSEQRISHLAHRVIDTLWKEDCVDFEDDARALMVAKAALTHIFGLDDRIDALVREKLNRQKKVPGSREWQILYEKYFQEESERQKW